MNNVQVLFGFGFNYYCAHSCINPNSQKDLLEFFVLILPFRLLHHRFTGTAVTNQLVENVL